MEKPGIQDLFTINLSETAHLWYRIGLELGLSVETLKTIEANNAKPERRKRAMFREWLKVCPSENCTWSHLIKALAKLDQNLAKSVSQTIAMDSPKPTTVHTATFPLRPGSGSRKDDNTATSGSKYDDTASVSSSLSLSSATYGRQLKPQTDIISMSSRPTLSPSSLDESSVLQRQPASKVYHETSRESDTKPSGYSLTHSKSHEESSHESDAVDEMRSLSTDAYLTASEDELIQPFNSQHGGDTPVHQSAVTIAKKDQIICDALSSVSTEEVRHLIEQKIMTPQVRLQHNRTPLMYATLQGAKDVVNCLLKIKDYNSLTQVDQDGAMALYFAINNEDNCDIAKMIIDHHIKQGVGLNLLVKGTPLIIFPASKGFHKMCELLLDNRADPNLRDKDGETALIIAASRGHTLVVRVLLKNNADINVVSLKSCRSALEEAVHGNHTDTIKLLMEASARHKSNNLKLFTSKTREDIASLVKCGAKVNTRHGDETTPLMVHAQRGNLDVVQELLQLYANVDLCDVKGETALMKASAHGHIEVADALLESGAIVNLKSTNGHTALTEAVCNKHPGMVEKLLVAGADIGIRDKNGNSIEDLAMMVNDQEIIEAIKRAKSGSQHEGQFVDLLSRHLQDYDKKDSVAIKEESSRKAAKREELLKKLPKSTRDIEDEETFLKKELEKANERIESLISRVKDLEEQITKEVAGDDELSDFSREALELEYRKLKELKRKAEQYAIESKQQAQRQSAENFKLRENVSKERHHNELTHKSIVRELEEIVDKSHTLKERTQAKQEIFEMEVAKRARQMVMSSTVTPHRLGSFKFDRNELKTLIFKHSLMISHNLVVVGGLPSSGKSTLLNNMLKISEEDENNICKLPGLRVMEAAVMINPYTTKPTPPWLSAITKEDAEVLMFATCLAQICAKRDESLTCALDEIEGSGAIQSPQFKMPVVNAYFERAFKRLRDLCGQLERDGYLNYLQHASLSFFNVWDIGVNKAVYEIMSLIARRCPNLILLNVLSLKESDLKNLNLKLNLQDFARYHGQYRDREDDKRCMQVQSAGTYYSRFVTICSQLRDTCLLVGTHKDNYEGHKPQLSEASANVRYLVEDKVADYGFTTTLHPQLFPVDARRGEDAQKLCSVVESMVVQDSRYERAVPLNWIMLRGVLQATNRLFMQKSEVLLYATECGLQSSEELESWLDMFQGCMSIIYSPDSSFTSLHNNVIIHPFGFVECLDRLYYAEFNDRYRFDSQLAVDVDLMRKGILTFSLAQKLWPDDSDAASLKHKGQNAKCNFILKVLTDIKKCTRLDNTFLYEPAIASPTEQLYFVPSLRPLYSHTSLSEKSDSLIIFASGVHQACCDVYSELVGFIQQQEQKKLRYLPGEFYDVLHFKWMDSESEADVYFKMLDLEDLVEVSVSVSNKLPLPESQVLPIKQKICSMMKTHCIEFFHKLSRLMTTMRYKLNVVSPICPRGEDGKVHLVPFDATSDKNVSHLVCFTCGAQVLLSQCPDHRKVWITSAYQGSPHQVVSVRDTLDRNELVTLSGGLYKSSSAKVTMLAKHLGIQEAEMQSLRGVCTSEDFPLLVLLEWKKRQAVASRPKLARTLLYCGFRELALQLDETVESSDTGEHYHYLLSNEISEIVTTRIPEERWEEFGVRLSLPTKEMKQFLQIKPPAVAMLTNIIQGWLKKQPMKDAISTVEVVLIRMDLKSCADLLRTRIESMYGSQYQSLK